MNGLIENLEDNVEEMFLSLLGTNRFKQQNEEMKTEGKAKEIRECIQTVQCVNNRNFRMRKQRKLDK